MASSSSLLHSTSTRNRPEVALDAPPPVFPEKIPLAAPTLPPVDEVLPEIRRLLEQSQLTNGATVRRFEEEAADYLGVSECVAVSSCTSGLMLVERLLGLSGEVIVPSFTFFATGHGLLWNGLEPVMVDCDPRTFNRPNRDGTGARPSKKIQSRCLPRRVRLAQRLPQRDAGVRWQRLHHHAATL